MLAFGRMTEIVDVIADAIVGETIVTYSVELAGRLNVKTGGVDWCGKGTGAGKGGINVLGEFVHADDEDDVARAEGDCGNTITGAVDIHNYAVLGDGIGAAEIVIARECLEINLSGGGTVGCLVAVIYLIFASLGEGCGNTDVTDGHRSSPCHTAA